MRRRSRIFLTDGQCRMFVKIEATPETELKQPELCMQKEAVGHHYLQL